MPAPNPLSPEEEAMFGEHGVPSAGPGKEPVVESQEDVQPPAQEEVVEEQSQEPEVSRHRDDGTFKTREEFERDMAAAAAAEEGGKKAKQPAEGQEAQPGEEGQQQPRMVPHEALHETRQRLANVAQRAQLAEARLNALLTRQQAQTQEQEMPDLVNDPVGYIQALEGRLRQFETDRRQETEHRELDNALDQDEALFATMVPDYERASEYYVQSRARELLQFHAPQDAQRIMTQEARQIARAAWERGQSAGQAIYALAQARGYSPGNTAADPTLHPLPPRPQQPQQQQKGPTAQDIVRGVNQGQKASKSLSGGGAGGAGTTALNAEAVLNMTDEEFEEHFGLGKPGANARFAQIG